MQHRACTCLRDQVAATKRVLPLTVILKLFLTTLPASSSAVQRTGVMPIWNVDPEAGSHTATTLGSTVSVTVGVAKVMALPALEVAWPVLLFRVPMTGLVVSVTW